MRLKVGISFDDVDGMLGKLERHIIIRNRRFPILEEVGTRPVSEMCSPASEVPVIRLYAVSTSGGQSRQFEDGNTYIPISL
jgi:hypothetical protein